MGDASQRFVWFKSQAHILRQLVSRDGELIRPVDVGTVSGHSVVSRRLVFMRRNITSKSVHGLQTANMGCEYNSELYNLASQPWGIRLTGTISTFWCQLPTGQFNFRRTIGILLTFLTTSLFLPKKLHHMKIN